MALSCHLLQKGLFNAGIAAFALCALQATSAQSATVTLLWNPNHEPNIVGYWLYYGTSSQTYTEEVHAGNSTTVTVSGLSGGTVYFFAVTAYNTAGVESTFSNEVAYAPPSQTPPPSPGPTSTPAHTPTPVNISGTISYCSNPVPGPVPNVTLTLVGTTSGSTFSNISGNYTFSSLPSGGNYVVTPTKAVLTPGSPGINGVDVLAVQRHFLGTVLIPVGCRRTAADVNGDANINGVDVLAIQRFFLGRTSGIGKVGKGRVHSCEPLVSGDCEQPGRSKLRHACLRRRCFSFCRPFGWLITICCYDSSGSAAGSRR